MYMSIPDAKWLAKRYVLSVILIVLTQFAESQNRNLPNIINGNYIPLYLVIGVLAVGILNICRMNRTVKESKLIPLRRNKIRFILVTVPGFIFDFYAELLAVVIFFLSLFYFAFGTKNPYIELLLDVFHYLIGLVLSPGLAYLFERLKRRYFGPLTIDNDSLFCNKSLKIVKMHYIVFSLTLLILINLFLIQTGS